MKNTSKLITAFIITTLFMLCLVFGVSAADIGEITELKAVSDSESVTLTWNTADKATGYRVFERVDGKWKALKTTYETSYTVEDLTPGTRHNYAVRAYTKQSGATVWADTLSYVYTGTKPLTVTVKATQTTDSVTLTWNKASDVAGYRIFLYNSTAKKWDIVKSATTDTTVTFNDLKSGNIYIYAVRPFLNTGKEILWADTYTKAVTATQPVAPANMTASATGSDVRLDWSESGYAVGYRVFKYNPTAKKWEQVERCTYKLFTIIRSLEPETNYIFAVRAYVNTGTEVIWSPTYTKATAKTDYDGYWDAEVCPFCLKSDCVAGFYDYYCPICKKIIPNFTCHPKEHFNAAYK